MYLSYLFKWVCPLTRNSQLKILYWSWSSSSQCIFEDDTRCRTIFGKTLFMAKSGLFISCKFCNGERKISPVVNYDNSCNPHFWWNLGGISDNSHDVTQIRNFPKSSEEHSSDLWKQSVWGKVIYPLYLTTMVQWTTPWFNDFPQESQKESSSPAFITNTLNKIWPYDWTFDFWGNFY